MVEYNAIYIYILGWVFGGVMVLKDSLHSMSITIINAYYGYY